MVNMGTVWDRTTEFVSDNLSAILPIALFAMFVPQSISGAVGQAKDTVGPVLSQIIVLVLLLPILWGQLAVVALAIDPDAGRADAQSVASRRFGQMLLAMLLLFVVIVVLSLPILIALAASGVDLTAMSDTNAARPAMAPGIAIFILLYALVLAGVVIFIAVRASTLLFAVVAAEGGVIAALRRSFALTRGIFWKMFGVLFLFGMVFAVAYLAVTFVFGTLFRFLAPDAGPFGIGAIVVAILVGLLTTTYSIIVSVFSAKLYRAVTTARAPA